MVLAVLGICQAALIVLLSLALSFDWLNHLGSGYGARPIDEVVSEPEAAPFTGTDSPDDVDSAPPAEPVYPFAPPAAPSGSPAYLSPYEATELVRSAISLISRFPVDNIGPMDSLRDVDVNTPERIDHLKGMLRLSIESSMGGSLDAMGFSAMLPFTQATTVADAGTSLATAIQVAWSPL